MLIETGINQAADDAAREAAITALRGRIETNLETMRDTIRAFVLVELAHSLRIQMEAEQFENRRESRGSPNENTRREYRYQRDPNWFIRRDSNNNTKKGKSPPQRRNNREIRQPRQTYSSYRGRNGL